MHRPVVLFAGFFVCSLAHAMPTTIVDTTNGSAINDGTINGGEYVGASAGINAGFGNVIGSSSMLHVDSSRGGALHFGLQSGGGLLNDAAVIYIDSVFGGFTDTTGFNDTGDALRRAISGTDGTNRSDIFFAPGFQADYAIAFESGFAGLWALNAGGSHNFLAVLNLNPPGNPGAGMWEMNLLLSDIGLVPGDSFDYIATYLNPSNAFRSDEFHGVAQSTVAAGNIGQNPVTLASGDYNTFVSNVPLPAAIWLFLSALAIPAFLRNRKAI